MEPVVSVIIPAWNCAGLLRETLRSVVAQTFTRWEVVVVDDGSTDETLHTAHAFAAETPRIKVLSQTNRGPSAARNAGARIAAESSRYFIFLDADDLLEKDALETLCSYMDLHSYVGLTHFECSCIDAHGQTLRANEIDFSPMQLARYVPALYGARKLRREEIETPFLSIYNLAGIIPSLAFVRRNVFEASGRWDESMKQMYEDTDLWLRMALRSRVHYLPRTLVRYRRHAAQSTTANRSSEFENRLGMLIEKWTQGDGLDFEQRKIVHEAEAFRLGKLAFYKNLRQSKQHLCACEPMAALRFLYGALRVALGLTHKGRLR